MKKLIPLVAVLLAASLGATAQQAAASSPAKPVPAEVRTLVGTVSDSGGNPIRGVTVTVLSDKSQVSITNSEGSFLLRTAAAAPILLASYAGYFPLELPVVGQQPTAFTLVPIEGYKRQLKKDTRAARKAYRQ